MHAERLLRAYLGHEPRERRAYDVAHATLLWHAGLDAQPLDSDALRARGLLWRPEDLRGQRYDLTSQAHASTGFAVSRFLVPILCQSGWAIFLDGDVVVLDDLVGQLLPLLDDDKALMVVQHDWQPTSTTKMDAQIQQAYRRKNWSSVMAFNCDHPANRRLTLHDVNTRPGLWLHQFGWLHDSELGALPGAFNWLVGEQARPPRPIVAHYTLGGPFLAGWPGGAHDEDWLRWENELLHHRRISA